MSDNIIESKGLFGRKLKILSVVAAILACPLLMTSKSPVKQLGVEYPSAGLSGNNIALWNSHGRYYNFEKKQWMWQRCHLHQTVEDLYTSAYILDLLVPMLENAGAYVMLPRERDTSPVEVIVDGDSPLSPGYSDGAGWKTAQSVSGFAMPGGQLGDRCNPFREGKVRASKTVGNRRSATEARWHAEIPQRGTYTVYVSYASLPESSSAAYYTVNSLRGEETFVVDQTMGGGTWIRLGEFPFEEGLSELPVVALSNYAEGRNVGKTVTADAVKIGGGMGNVARGSADAAPSVSGLPRWAEGSRYWLQWAGVPDSIYSKTDYENDYTDDYNSRPRWVNYLAGGSSKLPKVDGLKIPIDISFALHTDAGNKPDSTFVGTLAIFNTDRSRRLGDGRRRTTCRHLAETVLDNVVNDIRALHEPRWNRRKLRDKRYAEATGQDVPSLLLELLSHQNFSDMLWGQNPEFRFTAARAIYKGLLKYQAGIEKRRWVVQPLPPRNFAIESRGEGQYRLHWSATVDSLEESARPSAYIVELRQGDGAFKKIADVKQTSFDFTAPEGELCSFRIIARNEGGLSFPSETLSLAWCNNRNPEVLIVNGFTRLSAPAWFETDSLAGFVDAEDYGVPYVRNVAYSGSQFEFDRQRPWSDDIVDPGYGGSFDHFDVQPVAGNTFDYPAVHGEAIASAGYSFTSASLEAYLNNPRMFNQPVIDLILGKQKEIMPGRDVTKTRFKTFPAALQRKLSAHAAKGGSLLVSGEFIGADLFDNPYSCDSVRAADKAFASEVLGLEFVAKYEGEDNRMTLNRAWFTGNTAPTFGYSSRPNSETYAVGSPGILIPAVGRGARSLATFGSDGECAGVYSRGVGDAPVVALSVPFEAVGGAEMRNQLMEFMLNYLTPLKRPMAEPNPDSAAPEIDIVIPTPDSYKSINIKKISNISND